MEQRIVKVFIAGSITLKKERQAIRDLYMSINNAVEGLKFFYVRAFDDFGASGQQQHYDKYIKDADYVIFLIDQEIGSGKHTLKEFEIARNAAELNDGKRPVILIFYRQIHELIPHPEFIQECDRRCFYYRLYGDVADLRSQLLYEMFIRIVKEQKETIHDLRVKLDRVGEDMKVTENLVLSEINGVIQMSDEEEKTIKEHFEDIQSSDTEEVNTTDNAGFSREAIIEIVKELHGSLINVTKSILSMVQDLADTGDLSFSRQVIAVGELKDNMRTSSLVLSDDIYADIERFVVDYPQKGYNAVLAILREAVNKGVTSFGKVELEALHAELLKAMPIDETQDQLNALIHTLQDYCNGL